MKAFKDFMEMLTLQQRKLKSRVAKRKAPITAIKRKKSMKRPPTPDKIKTQKMGAKWERQLKPIIKKKMKDDFKQRKLAAKEK